MNKPTEWWKEFFHGVSLDLWRQAVTDEQTRAETDFIQHALQLPPGAKVLDAPCGNGRLSIELASRGYDLTGVDIAREFIEEARAKSAERGLSVRFEPGDVREISWTEEFAGAFCFGNSFGYFADEDNMNFLNAVSRALTPGARFIIDTGMIAESVLPNFQERRWMPVGDILFLIANTYDHAASRLNTEYTFVREGHQDRRLSSHRVYSYRELSQLLEEAGFTNPEGYSSLSQEPYKFGAHRLLLVAVKKPA